MANRYKVEMSIMSRLYIEGKTTKHHTVDYDKTT